MPSRIFLRLLAAALGLAVFTAEGAELAGRGIHRFDSSTGCPVETATHACNRIALDDADTHATLSPETRLIRFDNRRSYGTSTLVGDVLLHGTAQAADGRTVPVSVHVLVQRSGTRWSSSVHAHTPVDGKLTHVNVDAYRIVAEGDAGQVLYRPEDGLKVLADPSLAAQLAHEFVQVRNNTAAAMAHAGSQGAVSDITIALGLGRVAKPMVHSRLMVADSSLPLAEALKRGTWALDLEALSSHVPLEVVQRDLFLYGLEQHPLLQPLRAHGFPKRGTLTLGSVNGRRYLRYGGQRADFEQAPDAALAFLQDSFIGLILADQQQHR